MDPHNDLVDQPDDPTEEPVTDPTTSETIDNSASANEPAPVIPEIVPADQPLQGETPAADFSTVGTGSVFAISCTLLSILFVFICVAFFILFRVF
jgi:hypothetical protein